MKYIRERPSVDELCEQYSITADEIKKRNIYINSIKKILSGDDSRKLIIVGPCSADRKRQSLNTLADYESYLTKYTTGFLFFQGYTW